MKKTDVINSELSTVIANMGHMDWLSIGDAGMPVPMGTKKIDLALSKGLPSFQQVLKNILTELEVQKIYLAEEIKTQNPEQLSEIKKTLPNVAIEYVPHTQLKKDLAKTHAFVRTGEMTPFSNIILESGVTF
ncbi:D-ribose pyranase [Lentilactobacillus hilgardii]|uniref:D-ribose pyranase n=1 Tax=Lentilactobacillus hilgardii (strain ATCC 8290 / DSM 20176 / CCUG 30140 / JCM 1155 / KCTC 3500 / NBRC 15886 / NCIMB 8040 / NRRL B-1843 / 9) TaxID=1423757 RepID=C0XJ39_LENH9|nr:D-ribose pyranase [Lentilactobacillus hilgardii]EEI24618.1 RbsD/FucU transport family protein [Lentilactobacillus hilgardii DSM 20176 = ATCC 8290]KRK57313.1 ribose ABC superfamily ATP binding cassette transporter, membrane protein [Lentilactobacillus hilgardii DSM 20176 = ATCC 8290]MCP9332952.1 D-ribose pyranase [Lentilactobacillus hilgardii]MCP9349589.1 D-ribose pyranase [Lentilactobacillus hilgardii]MCP9352457.1 D-ribose pyranase [Lentilactobacillus hilgardii]